VTTILLGEGVFFFWREETVAHNAAGEAASLLPKERGDDSSQARVSVVSFGAYRQNTPKILVPRQGEKLQRVTGRWGKF